MSRNILFLFLSLFVSAGSFAGPTLTIVSKDGVRLLVELLGIDDESASVRVIEQDKEFEVPLSSLDAASVALLKEKGAALPVKYPKVEMDVVVKKRRKPSNSSSYMKVMTVGATVKVENKSLKHDYPESEGRLVFIGQDQRNPEILTVLSVEDFSLAPKAGKIFEKVLDDFDTKYDSDNKGHGNIGGFKYIGYLLILHDGEGRILGHKTTSGVISKEIGDNLGVLTSMLKVKSTDNLDEKMMPTGVRSRMRM